jgi:hypothetical protein
MEPSHWLEQPDPAAESGADLRREISHVTADIKDDGLRAERIVQAKLPVALGRQPEPMLGKKFVPAPVTLVERGELPAELLETARRALAHRK